MNSCFRPSALALIAFAAVATCQSSRAQTLAGRPDRYGVAQASAAPTRAPSLNAATALRIRYLTWPGKVMPTTAPVLRAELTAPSPAPVEDGAWRRLSTYPVDRLGPARTGTAQPPLWNPPAIASLAPGAQPPAGLRPQRYEEPARHVANVYARPAPDSIYDVPEPIGREPLDQSSVRAAPPALRGRHDPSSQAEAQAQLRAPTRSTPPQIQQAAFPTPQRARPANGESVRFYSVHRAFGLRPDPAPIPPQFFAATPDLSDPPGPIANRRVAAGAGLAARNAVQAQDSDATTQP